METRILNRDTLLATGNIPGRNAVLEILETGLQASDPYINARRLIRKKKGMLVVGNRDFEPAGTSKSGNEVFKLLNEEF